MKTTGTGLVLIALLLTSLSAFTSVQAQYGGLQAPFGFFWGDDIENVRATLTGAATTIEEKKAQDDRQVWKVTGLIRPGMQHAVFLFKKGALVEIELVYQEETWGAEQYERLMQRNREFFTNALGDPQVVKEEGEIEDGVHQTMTGYEWSEFDTQLFLLNYRVEQKNQAFQSVSVHYRYAFADDLDNAGMEEILEDIDDPLPITENDTMPGDDLPSNPAATPEPLPTQQLPQDPEAVEPLPLPAGTPEPTAETVSEPSPTPETSDAEPNQDASPAPAPTANPTPAQEGPES